MKTELDEKDELILQFGSASIFLAKEEEEEEEEEARTVVSLSDITERKRTEESLKLFRTLIDQSNDAIEVIDPETGRFIDVNETACLSIGYSREEYLSMKVFDIDPMIDQSAFTGTIEEMRKSGTLLWEGIHQRKDRSTFPVEVNLKYVQLDRDYLVAIARDITERKRAEDALRESEEQYRDLVEKGNIAIAVDDIHGNLIYFNNQFCKLFGYSAEEIKSKTHKILVHPDDFEMVSKYHKMRIQGKEPPSRYEFRGVRKDGSIVNIEIDVCKILTKESEFSGSQSYLWDITKRKKNEETLRISEAQLSNAMMIAKLGYWEYDVDDDLFTFNDHFYDIFRTTAEKVGGYKMSPERYARQFIHPDDISIVGIETRKAIETKDPDFSRQLEHRIIYADGKTGYISVRFFIIKDSHGRTVKTYGANQDITERKILEDEFKDSEIRYHNLFENSSEFLYTLDLKGNFTDVNKAAEALTGYTKSELLKMNFKDYTQKRDHRKLSCAFSTIYKTGKSVHDFPVEAIIKDKSIKHFETSLTLLKKGDQIIGFHGSSKDITERKRAENALRESEERYRSLVENIDFGVTMIDKDFKIIMTNGIIGQWHNKPTYKFEGKNCFEEFEKRQAICQHCPGVKAMATGQPHQVETEGVRDDGSHFSVLVHAFPLSGPDDVVKGFIEVIEDIAERKRAEEELLRAKEKAEAGNRLKTAFMNNISHEIRTPLNGILGFSNLITQPDITDEEKAEYYSLIKTSSNRLLSTISNYMDSSLIASGTMEVNRKYMDLHPMLHQLRAQFQPLCDHKNLECHLQLPGKTEPITIYSDEELFRKVLCHLLDNAAKFTTKGGITFGYAIKPGVLEFFVKDTGSGISKEAQTRIFESFVQEELLHTRGYEGSGLGLSIAQGFVRLLGGEMGLESEKGAGSTFFFTLPWEERETGIITKTEGIQKGALAENQVILIVEDDESNLLFIQTILRKAAVTVLVANNGKEAVDGCRAHPEISLVLMDLRMPVMDGLEATRVIKTFRKNLPIIAITAFAMSGDETRARDAGCDDYLSKPISREALLEKLKQFEVV